MTLDTAKFTKRAALLATFICLAPLTGCLTTPVSSMVKLSRLNPLDAKPSDMRFAVRTPHYLRVRDGDITMRLSFDSGKTDTSFIEVYRPVIDENARPEQGITIGAQDGSRLAIARLSDDDAASMRAAQKRIEDWRASGVEGSGSFSVAATGCAQSAVPDGKVPITIWLRTSPAEDYFILTRNVDLRGILKEAGQNFNEIPACER